MVLVAAAETSPASHKSPGSSKRLRLKPVFALRVARMKCPGFGLWNGVKTGGGRWMTTGQATNSQPGAAQRAVLDDRQPGVLRARRDVPA